MPNPPPTDELLLKLSLAEINLLLEALGQLPYARVHEVIARIQRQAHQQLQPAPSPTAANPGPAPTTAPAP